MHGYDTSLSLKKMARILQVGPTMEVSQGSITKASEQSQPSQGKLNVVFYLDSVMCWELSQNIDFLCFTIPFHPWKVLYCTPCPHAAKSLTLG